MTRGQLIGKLTDPRSDVKRERGTPSGTREDQAGAGAVREELAATVDEACFAVRDLASALEHAALGCHLARLERDGTQVVDADVERREALVGREEREIRKRHRGIEDRRGPPTVNGMQVVVRALVRVADERDLALLDRGHAKTEVVADGNVGVLAGSDLLHKLEAAAGALRRRDEEGLGHIV